MIKKHLITCSVMLALLLAAKATIYSRTASFTELSIADEDLSNMQDPVDHYFNSLSFANESLPLGDEIIKSKMNSTLHSYSFNRLQTSKLHHLASKWFPVIEPILKAYGIPEDFKYVPLVESGLKGGVSPKGAAGYWQFMPQTARDFGLTVNAEVDERNDIHKSSVAAAKYIRALYRQFDSWTLAAAAYNVGEGRLKRQINLQNQDNYFKMRLNRETASYVYKLISMKEIIENPTRYGYTSKVSRLLARNNIHSDREFPYRLSTKNREENSNILVN